MRSSSPKGASMGRKESGYIFLKQGILVRWTHLWHRRSSAAAVVAAVVAAAAAAVAVVLSSPLLGGAPAGVGMSLGPRSRRAWCAVSGGAHCSARERACVSVETVTGSLDENEQ